MSYAPMPCGCTEYHTADCPHFGIYREEDRDEAYDPDDYLPEPEPDELCAVPGCDNLLDDGEGYDGYCGTHADQLAKEGHLP